LNALADKGATDADVTAITKRVNGGTHGLPDRIAKFKVFNTDELAIDDLVNDINTLGICSIEELRVVCNHYYYILKQMKGDDTIDELDMDVLMGKLVIDELNGRW
jgi:hypothetical protein